eukprot:GDKJ01017163.1.p1 GENE.GDKJ01017163.1~~GDKJ01017163.1.p1  ORF type:complete len:875 (-),score=293.60 GDKJ01017163.1:338-2962(-)
MNEAKDQDTAESMPVVTTQNDVPPISMDQPPKRPAAQDDFRTKFKTEMCKSWIETGECAYSARCTFAHGLDEMRKKTHVTNKYKTRPCKRFIQFGWCPYGPRCLFIHNNSAEIDEDVGPLLSQDLMIILGGDADMSVPVRTPKNHQNNSTNQQQNQITSPSKTPSPAPPGEDIPCSTIPLPSGPAALLASVIGESPMPSTPNHLPPPVITSDNLMTSSLMHSNEYHPQTSSPLPIPSEADSHSPFPHPAAYQMSRATTQILSPLPSSAAAVNVLDSPSQHQPHNINSLYSINNNAGGVADANGLNISIGTNNNHHPPLIHSGSHVVDMAPPTLLPRASAPAFLCPPHLQHMQNMQNMQHSPHGHMLDDPMSPLIDPHDPLVFMSSQSNHSLLDESSPSLHPINLHHNQTNSNANNTNNNNNNGIFQNIHLPRLSQSQHLETQHVMHTSPSMYPHHPYDTPLHHPFPSPTLHSSTPAMFSFPHPSPGLQPSPQPSPPMLPARSSSSSLALPPHNSQPVTNSPANNKPSLFAIRAGLAADMHLQTSPLLHSSPTSPNRVVRRLSSSNHSPANPNVAGSNFQFSPPLPITLSPPSTSAYLPPPQQIILPSAQELDLDAFSISASTFSPPRVYDSTAFTSASVSNNNTNKNSNMLTSSPKPMTNSSSSIPLPHQQPATNSSPSTLKRTNLLLGHSQQQTHHHSQQQQQLQQHSPQSYHQQQSSSTAAHSSSANNNNNNSRNVAVLDTPTQQTDNAPPLAPSVKKQSNAVDSPSTDKKSSQNKDERQQGASAKAERETQKQKGIRSTDLSKGREQVASEHNRVNDSGKNDHSSVVVAKDVKGQLDDEGNGEKTNKFKNSNHKNKKNSNSKTQSVKEIVN